MPSLLRNSRPAFAAIAHPSRERPGAIEQDRDGELQQTVGTRPINLQRTHRQSHCSNKPTHDLALQLLLGLGLSLLGSGSMAPPVSAGIPQQTLEAIAESIPHRSTTPTAPSQSVRLPLPSALAQSSSAPTSDTIKQEAGSEVIEGDSEARQPSSPSKGSIYTPIRLKSGITTEDTLTTQDIPMGQGSFARDYIVTLKAKDQIAIDLSSENFDTVVTLMSKNGTTLGENDDGPDGGTNSLLFMRITQDGDYVVRVRGFGQAKGGPFKLKLTRLTAAN